MRWFSNSVVALAACVAVTACAADDGQPANQPDDDPPVTEGDLDREELEATARGLLGRPEEELTLGTDARVVRRGDEEFPATMDHVPGRFNIELDDDGSGEPVVSKVVVEVPDGEDPLVVEP